MQSKQWYNRSLSFECFKLQQGCWGGDFSVCCPPPSPFHPSHGTWNSTYQYLRYWWQCSFPALRLRLSAATGILNFPCSWQVKSFSLLQQHGVGSFPWGEPRCMDWTRQCPFQIWEHQQFPTTLFHSGVYRSHLLSWGWAQTQEERASVSSLK